MKISVLIPCHNEEKSIRTCVESCLTQTRKFDQILVINDGSTDNSGKILKEFGKKIDVITIPKATGNKSRAQEAGLPFIIGDVFVSTDGDTKLSPNFAMAMEKEFQDEKVVAVSGMVKSLPYNWLTAVRAFEYTIAHYFHKMAQSYLDYIFVISGAAGAFRTEVFREHLPFEHDTLTEDLDITFKLHKKNLKIAYTTDAICYTQDPMKLSQYKNQMRRWYGGGWQGIKKHVDVVISKPNRALEMSLIYTEGILFSIFLFLLPLINLRFAFWFWMGNIAFNMIFAVVVAVKEKRFDVLYVPFIYPMIVYINAFIFLEQGFKEVILKKKNLVWFHPERVEI